MHISFVSEGIKINKTEQKKTTGEIVSRIFSLEAKQHKQLYSNIKPKVIKVLFSLAHFIMKVGW